jgi:hypothetical protein
MQNLIADATNSNNNYEGLPRRPASQRGEQGGIATLKQKK